MGVKKIPTCGAHRHEIPMSISTFLAMTNWNNCKTKPADTSWG